MKTSTAEMAGLYFKRIEGVSLSDQGADIQMFNIVVALDGNRDLQTIAREEGYDLDDLLQKISRLQDMGHTRHSLPRNKLAELIRRIGERISDRSSADEFIEKAAVLMRRAG